MRFLSNFYPASVIYQGRKYRTSEHAFQAAKTLDKNQRKTIAAFEEPALAKRMGRVVELREDWEDVKLGVMKIILRDKFKRNADLRKQLLATGDSELIEGNVWGDTYWGVCQGKGENHLGKLLMEVRQELQEGEDGSSPPPTRRRPQRGLQGLGGPS
jgi:ribA/ribD-fused uncharacterized protein